jgi:non-heme chloroperoxidase
MKKILNVKYAYNYYNSFYTILDYTILDYNLYYTLYIIIYIIYMIPWTTYNMSKFKTGDNANIYFFEQKPLKEEKGILIILPGWSYIPESWSPVLLTNEYLKNHYRTFILITRGYNNELYNYGNTLDRYSVDIYEFLNAFHLKNVTLLGHSIGSAIIWRMISLFGENMFKNYIIVDEPPVLLNTALNRSITNKSVQKSMFYTEKMLDDAYKTLHGQSYGANKYKTGFAYKLFTTKFQKEHPEIVDKVSKGSLKFNNKVLADILINNVAVNNIEVILQSKIISKPTLIIGGEQSVISYKTILDQKKYYKHAEVYIFKGDYSSHSAFIENYSLFNTVLNTFLKERQGQYGKNIANNTSCNHVSCKRKSHTSHKKHKKHKKHKTLKKY